MRTTLDIDEPILRDLKRRAKRERKSLGRLASDLLAKALKASETAGPAASTDSWTARPMGARVDLADAEALYSAMESGSGLPARVAEEEK